MTGASPSDLAVTFTSVPRRLREAQGSVPDSVVAGPAAQLGALLVEAGRLLSTSADPLALAAAVSSVHPDDWDEAVLSRLREIALDVGRLLRRIAALADTA